MARLIELATAGNGVAESPPEKIGVAEPPPEILVSRNHRPKSLQRKLQTSDTEETVEED